MNWLTASKNSTGCDGAVAPPSGAVVLSAFRGDPKNKLIGLVEPIRAAHPLAMRACCCGDIGPAAHAEDVGADEAADPAIVVPPIAQVWLHHTGHDTKGFGTKTKEWKMDTVAMLSKQADDGSVLLDFRKARLRTPQTADLFKTQLIRRNVTGWITEPGTIKAKESAGDCKRAWLRGVYGDLAGDVVPTPGHTKALVMRKVPIKDIRLPESECSS